jgi:hypothetical protein
MNKVTPVTANITGMLFPDDQKDDIDDIVVPVIDLTYVNNKYLLSCENFSID